MSKVGGLYDTLFFIWVVLATASNDETLMYKLLSKLYFTPKDEQNEKESKILDNQLCNR